MRRATSRRFANALCRAPEAFRPHLETLEERLPPGDAVLSALTAGSLGAAGFHLAGTPAAALTTPPRPARGTDYLVSAGAVPAGAGHFQSTFAAATVPGRQSHPVPDKAGAGQDQARPVSRRLAELDPNLLDGLLGDDWDVPVASKPRAPFQTANPEGVAPAPTFLEGGGRAGPGAKDQPTTAPVVQPATPSHGDIIPFSQQGEIPPDDSRTPPPPPSGGATPPDTPPVDDSCDCNSSGEVNGTASGAGGGYDGAREFSDGPVRYFDGTVKMQFTDLRSNGYGTPWGVTRTWTNAGWAASYPGSTRGTGMVVSQQPFLLQGAGANGAELMVVTSGWNTHFFDDHITYFTPHYYLNESLTHNPSSQHYLFTDSKGDKLSFWDFTVSGPYQRGQLDTFTDPGGNMTVTAYDPALHVLTSVQRTFTLGGTTVTEKFVYTYNDTLKVTNVMLQRQIIPLGWSTVRQVQYTYYTGTNSNGDQYGAQGELRSAAIKDASGNVLDVYYYRYYNGSDNGSIGYSGGLKYYFSPQSYARLKAAGMGDPVTADLTDAQVQNYADNYFEYTRNPSTSEEQVSLERVQGQGCACGGGNVGQGTYTFTYSTSSFAPGFNSWRYKTVETLPDNIPDVHVSQNVVYANYYGQVMLKVYQQGDAGQTPSQWATFYKYGDTGANPVGGGRTLMVASPSAIDSSFDLSYQERTFADLLDRNTAGDYGYLNSNTGLVTTTDYYMTTTATETQAGGVAGYVQDTKIQRGQQGTPALQSYTEYYAHTANSTTTYPVADERAYRNPTTNPDDAAKEVTSYHYSWFPNSHQMQSRIVTKPGISAMQNGPGIPGGQSFPDVETTFYDVFGRPTWHRNSVNPPDSQTADGYIDYTEYDQGTGAVVKTIQDVDATRTQDFLPPVPTDPHTGMPWATRADGGKHLKTTMVVDGLGRMTQETSPSANAPVNPAGHVTYTVYKDSNHEVRTYTWDPVANAQVGPTQVYREDRQQPTSYTETLTMTVPAHLTDGLPDGSESINDIQSLSRSFTSPGGQLVEKDDYFYLGSLSYSTAPVLPGAAAGTHYYATLYGYDARGRRDRAQSPTGTIQRTVYDGLGRVASTWVGTNDTVAAVTNTPVDLSSAFNRIGISTDGVGFMGGGLDGAGDAYSATFLHGSLTWNGLPFTLGPAGSNDAVAGGLGVTLNLPAGRDSALTLLATGVITPQDSQNFTVTYTDTSTQTFTPSLSEWWTPNNSSGESTAFAMPYYNTASGGQFTRRTYLYAYTFLLNPAKQVQSLTLPDNTDVVVLAATLTAAPWSPTNNNPPANMVKVSDNFYDQATIDGPSGVGDSNLTKTIQYPGGSAPARAAVNVYDWRDRAVVSKQGVQTTEDTTTHRPLIYTAYDNLNEVTQQQQFDADTVDPTMFLDPATGMPKSQYLSRLRAQSTTAYDDQGRVYQENTYNVVQSGPNAGTVLPGTLATNTWYDHRGNVIKTSAPGGLVTKTVYDGVNRATTVYTTDGAYDTAPGQSGTWTDAGNTLGDNVLTQVETTYDTDSNPILVTTRDRFHDNPLTAQMSAGDLQNPNTLPKARVSYVANYYDAADRLTNQVDFGTYGAATFSRPTTPPPRSNTALVTSYSYLADTVQKVALVGNPTSGSFTLTVTIQGTPYTTRSIQVTTATAAAVQMALNAAPPPALNASFQVSGPTGGPWNVRFVGSLAGTPVATMTGTGTGFAVAVGTTSEGGDTGRQQQMTDPLSLVQKTDYDLMDRTTRTIDSYANFAPSNGSDRTTEYTYDGDGHMLTLTAWTVPSVGATPIAETTQYVYGVTGSVINSNDLLAQVTYPANGQPNTERYDYDALGEMTTKKERNFNTSLNLPQTHVYAYDVLGRQTSDTATVLGTNVDGIIRRLDTAYDTGGRPYLYTSYYDTAGMTVANQVQQVYNGLGQLITEYQEHDGAVNTSTSAKVQYAYSEMNNGTTNHSRLTSMTYPNGRVISYNYAGGLDDAISRLTSLQSSGDTQPLEVESYLGLGTVVQRAHPEDHTSLTYIQQPGDTQANQDAGDQYTGLDRFGRVIDQLWVTSAAVVTDRFQYGYDWDGNVTSRNNLVNAAFSEQYGYDQFNQLTRFQRGSHTQGWGLDPLGNWTQFTNDGTPQSRTHNAQNQITAISGTGAPTYDNNGNTLSTGSLAPFTYDAWNRLVHLGNQDNQQTAYDALGRRILTLDLGVTDLYYSASWQVVEQRQGGAVQAQYVWSPAYVDALIERDTSLGRLYVQQDANWNVTGVLASAGALWAPAERYVYDPYGAATVLDPTTWTARSSSFNWIYLFQGGRFENTFQLYSFRNRDYSPALGRWMQQDPMGYAAGDTNLYLMDSSNPINLTDPSGLRPPWYDTGSMKRLDRPKYETPWWWSDKERVAAAEGIEQAYKRVKKALAFLEDDDLWCCLNKYYKDRPKLPHIKLLLANRDLYRKMLEKVVKGLQTTKTQFAGEEFFSVGEGPAYAKKGGPIYLRKQYFGDLKGWDDRGAVIVHELARVFLWDELPEENTDTTKDVYIWDKIINILWKNFDEIIKACKAEGKK